MKIGSVDLDRDVLVVAEIGNNHEGDFGLARDLVGLAAEAGAQAVKFQTIVPERLVGPEQTARLAQLKRFALSPEQHADLAATAAKAGVMFLSTPFDLGSVAMLDPLVPAFKIASGDNDFLPLLERVAATGKPILMSTGMAESETIGAACGVVRGVWEKQGTDPSLVLLHCVSAYPTLPAQANLRAITFLASYAATVGYSDHTLGVAAAPLAVALGARVIEKHFTIDHDHSDFRDHKLSANPLELKELVDRVRIANEMLGNGEKRVTDVEVGTATAARRSIVAARDLPAGHEIAWADLTWLRPAGGLSPGQEKFLLGRRLRADIPAGSRIEREQVD